MNVPSWKYSIHRLCIACYCNIHLTGQDQWTWGVWYWTRFQCCAGIPCSVPICGHAVTPGCRTVSVSAIQRCTHWYECSLCLSWGCLPVPAVQKGHAAVSDCFWEENVPPLSVRHFWLPSHPLTHRHTLLTSTGPFISGRQLMGHSESENLTDYSFSTLPS